MRIIRSDEPVVEPPVVAFIDYAGNLCFRTRDGMQVYIDPDGVGDITTGTPFETDLATAQRVFRQGESVTIQF